MGTDPLAHLLVVRVSHTSQESTDAGPQPEILSPMMHRDDDDEDSDDDMGPPMTRMWANGHLRPGEAQSSLHVADSIEELVQVGGFAAPFRGRNGREALSPRAILMREEALASGRRHADDRSEGSLGETTAQSQTPSFGIDSIEASQGTSHTGEDKHDEPFLAGSSEKRAGDNNSRCSVQ
mmetsp:Transcript_72680/g.151706  ORF Transcript_72680/g.151706 Transcript_72680/m.151706 type:complete len:180 (-) Transcript_72680:372-911(-)